MEKCPRCGYTQEAKKTYGNNIRHLTTKFSRLTRQLLRTVSSAIMTNIPSDNSQQQYYSFLVKIQDVDENCLRRVLKQYIESSYVKQGKGFKYLQAIILTENLNKDTKLRNEYKIGGRSPSNNLIKGDE